MSVVKFLMVAALVFVSADFACAKSNERNIAGWRVSVEKDPFGTDDRVIAMQIKSSSAFAFRCFSHKPQMAVLEVNPFKRGEFAIGDVYSVKLRIDDLPVVTAVGMAVSAELLQIETTENDIYKWAAKGKELAIRTELDGRTNDYRFSMKGASKALVDFYQSCEITP